MNSATKAAEPWLHWLDWLAIHQAFEVGNDFFRIVIRDGRAPTCTNAVGTINQDHWNGRDVCLRFNLLPFIVVVSEERLISRMEDLFGKWR